MSPDLVAVLQADAERHRAQSISAATGGPAVSSVADAIEALLIQTQELRARLEKAEAFEVEERRLKVEAEAAFRACRAENEQLRAYGREEGDIEARQIAALQSEVERLSHEAQSNRRAAEQRYAESERLRVEAERERDETWEAARKVIAAAEASEKKAEARAEAAEAELAAARSAFSGSPVADFGITLADQVYSLDAAREAWQAHAEQAAAEINHWKARVIASDAEADREKARAERLRGAALAAFTAIEDAAGHEYIPRLAKTVFQVVQKQRQAFSRAALAPEVEPPAEREPSRQEAWRPIETAPKDGTEVLLRVKMRAGIPGKMLVGHWMPGGHCIEDHPPISRGWYFWNGSMFDTAAELTHWMPLPEPPTGGASEQPARSRDVEPEPQSIDLACGCRNLGCPECDAASEAAGEPCCYGFVSFGHHEDGCARSRDAECAVCGHHHDPVCLHDGPSCGKGPCLYPGCGCARFRSRDAEPEEE